MPRTDSCLPQKPSHLRTGDLIVKLPSSKRFLLHRNVTQCDKEYTKQGSSEWNVLRYRVTPFYGPDKPVQGRTETQRLKQWTHPDLTRKRIPRRPRLGDTRTIRVWNRTLFSSDEWRRQTSYVTNDLRGLFGGQSLVSSTILLRERPQTLCKGWVTGKGQIRFFKLKSWTKRRFTPVHCAKTTFFIFHL